MLSIVRYPRGRSYKKKTITLSNAQTTVTVYTLFYVHKYRQYNNLLRTKKRRCYSTRNSYQARKFLETSKTVITRGIR